MSSVVDVRRCICKTVPDSLGRQQEHALNPLQEGNVPDHVYAILTVMLSGMLHAKAMCVICEQHAHVVGIRPVCMSSMPCLEEKISLTCGKNYI